MSKMRVFDPALCCVEGAISALPRLSAFRYRVPDTIRLSQLPGAWNLIAG